MLYFSLIRFSLALKANPRIAHVNLVCTERRFGGIGNKSNVVRGKVEAT